MYISIVILDLHHNRMHDMGARRCREKGVRRDSKGDRGCDAYGKMSDEGEGNEAFRLHDTTSQILVSFMFLCIFSED